MVAALSTSLGTLALLAVSAQAVQWGDYACMRSSGDMTKLGSSAYQSPGYCQKLCEKEKGYFFALQGEDCWCGPQPPGFNSMGGTCDMDCPGYPSESCGGDGTYSVWELEEDYADSPLGHATTSSTAVTVTTAAGSSSTGSSLVVDLTSASITSTSPATTSSAVASTSSVAQPVETTSASGASRRVRFLFS
ncbi:uncharacterized protein LDX57_008539 [Aspergillus melleus]|uniref:uncharacterized protein n=1 Tax=Aspergillus melleus TaxID=138277 RepID=UPI001E8D0B08|nr:uncharacterized protein LDX57_008539 [Aspergillus melleus]KAH8430875.1 hypothetical protein LDX57_008539 [Aspergillus melleus]